MELIYKFEEGDLLIDGVSECICKGEEHWGNPPDKLGTHFACKNAVRLMITILMLNEEKKVDITMVKVYPERIKKELRAGGKGMTYFEDQTKIEFWTDELILETNIEKLEISMRNYFIAYRKQMMDMKFNLHTAFKEKTGKGCRGLNMKYLPAGKKSEKVDDKDIAKLLEYAKNLSYKEALVEYLKLHPEEEVTEKMRLILNSPDPEKPQAPEVPSSAPLPDIEQEPSLRVKEVPSSVPLDSELPPLVPLDMAKLEIKE